MIFIFIIIAGCRASAILLVGQHISDISNSNNPVYTSRYNQNMRQYLQRQLEQQKELLFLDIPSLRNQKNFLSKLTSSNHSSCKSDEMCNMVGTSKNNLPTPCHVYENCLNTRDIYRDGSSSLDDLDDQWHDDDSSSSVEKFEFGALPTPASEQANFAVISQQYIFLNFSLFCHVFHSILGFLYQHQLPFIFTLSNLYLFLNLKFCYVTHTSIVIEQTIKFLYNITQYCRIVFS